MAILRGLKKQFTRSTALSEEKEVSGSAFLAAIAEDQKALANESSQNVAVGALESLDALYKVETISLSTVRKSVPNEPIDEEVEEETLEVFDEPLEKFPNDFLMPTLPSFVLYEPTQVLNLSKDLEGRLLSEGKERLHQLRGVKEVEESLQNYLGPHFTEESTGVDFEALLRAMLHPILPSLLKAGLRKYALHTLWEKSERKVFEHAEERCIQEIQQSKLYDALSKILQTFVVPWVQQREGIVTALEIEERLSRVATSKRHLQEIFRLFRDLYGVDWMSRAPGLIQIEEGVYSSNVDLSEQVKEIKELFLGFFYTDELSYELSDLIDLAEGVLLRKWKSVSKRVLIRVLRASSLFKILKREGGVVHVSLSKSKSCIS